jgi:hypothetical protein
MPPPPQTGVPMTSYFVAASRAAISLALLIVAACGGGGGYGGGGGGGIMYTVGGTVTGLTGSGLVLENNAGNNLPISAAGAFTFTASLASGAAYAVTVITQPSSPTQNCVVRNGSGTVGTANVTTVAVVCATVSSSKLGPSVLGAPNNAGAVTILNACPRVAKWTAAMSGIDLAIANYKSRCPEGAVQHDKRRRCFRQRFLEQDVGAGPEYFWPAKSDRLVGRTQ